jgi:hypothetical protein
VIRVPEDHESIQPGINAASSGDLIPVASGTYAEKSFCITSELGMFGGGSSLDIKTTFLHNYAQETRIIEVK